MGPSKKEHVFPRGGDGVCVFVCLCICICVLVYLCIPSKKEHVFPRGGEADRRDRSQHLLLQSGSGGQLKNLFVLSFKSGLNQHDMLTMCLYNPENDRQITLANPKRKNDMDLMPWFGDH